MLPAEKKASVLAGTWNSIQGSKPGLGQPNDGALPGLYETDLYPCASIELDRRWTVSGTCYRYVSPSACVIAREAKRGRLGRKPYFSLSWLGRNLEPERCALIIGPQAQRECPFTAIELTRPDQQFPVSRFIVVGRHNSLRAFDDHGAVRITLWPQTDVRGGNDISIIMPDPNGQSAIFQPAGDDFGSAVKRSKRGLAPS